MNRKEFEKRAVKIFNIQILKNNLVIVRKRYGMKTIIVLLFLVVFILNISCGMASVKPDFYLVKENEEISLPLQREIYKLDKNIIEIIQKGGPDELSGYFVTGSIYEQAIRQQNANVFPKAATLMKDKELIAYRDFYCTCSGESSAPCIVLPKTDYDFQVSIPRASNEMYVSLSETLEFNKLLLSLIYAKQNGQWKLFQYYIGSFKIAEKNAVQWYEEALSYYNQGNLTLALLRLDVAYGCLHPAPFLKYRRENEIIQFTKKAEAEFKDKYTFPIQLSDIKGNPAIYSIKGQFVQQDIIPVVWYVTSYKLEDVSNLKEEGNFLSPIVQEMFPGIAEGTKYIVFKAFTELPTDPQKVYNSYGTIVEIK